MKVIEYAYVCGTKTLQVRISYSEENLQIAKREAVDGVYTVREVPEDGVC